MDYHDCLYRHRFGIDKGTVIIYLAGRGWKIGAYTKQQDRARLRKKWHELVLFSMKIHKKYGIWCRRPLRKTCHACNYDRWDWEMTDEIGEIFFISAMFLPKLAPFLQISYIFTRNDRWESRPVQRLGYRNISFNHSLWYIVWDPVEFYVECEFQ